MKSSEHVTVNPCPICSTSGGHEYALAVERELVFAGPEDAAEKSGRYQVVFRCPVSSGLFKVTLRLRETPGFRIESVGEPTIRQSPEGSDG